MHMTPPTTFPAYIASQLARAVHFADKDDMRAADIFDGLEEYVKKHGPSGSGFDNGTTIDIDRSNETRLVFNVSFHHMNSGGFYDGWTEHSVIVRPRFGGSIDLRVSGRDRNGIKELIGEVFHNWLTLEVQHPALIEEN